eukprot:gene420-443_t
MREVEEELGIPVQSGARILRILRKCITDPHRMTFQQQIEELLSIMQRRLENYLTDEDSLKRLRYKTLRAEIATRVAERQNQFSSNASNDCDDPVMWQPSAHNTTVTELLRIEVNGREQRGRGCVQVTGSER